MWENADAIIILDKYSSGTEYCKVLQRLPYQASPNESTMITEKPNNTLSQLPGPKGLPILGNLLQIDLKKLHSILEEWAAVNGGIYQFKLFNKVVVAISEPSFIQSILRDRPETYRRVSAIERVGSELGSNGVFAAEREQWRHQRQVTIQAFKPEQLRQFFPVLHILRNGYKNIGTKSPTADKL